MRLGRCNDAIPEERRAISLDPRSDQYQSGIAEVYFNCRRYDEAAAEFQKSLEMGRDSVDVYWSLGEVYFCQGEYRKALALYGKTPWIPGWAYVPLGSRREALEHAARIRAMWKRGEAQGFNLRTMARLYASLGDTAEAITWLERLYDGHHGSVVYLKVDPHLDPLRGDPRFQALLNKVGLGH